MTQNKIEKHDLEELLVSCGFKGGWCNANRRELFIKRMPAREMPYINEHVVGTNSVFGGDTVTIEVSLDENTVELSIETSRYYEEATSLDTEEGMAILKDAGVKMGQRQNKP